MKQFQIFLKNDRILKKYELFLFSRVMDLNVIVFMLLNCIFNVKNSSFSIYTWIIIIILCILPYIAKEKSILFLESNKRSFCLRLIFLKYYISKLIFLGDITSYLNQSFNFLFIFFQITMIFPKNFLKITVKVLLLIGLLDFIFYNDTELVFISYFYPCLIFVGLFLLTNYHFHTQELNIFKRYLKIIPLPSFIFDQSLNILKENYTLIRLKSNPKYGLGLNITQIHKETEKIESASPSIGKSFDSLFKKFDIKFSNITKYYHIQESSTNKIEFVYKTIANYESFQKEFNKISAKSRKYTQSQYYIAVLYPKLVNKNAILKSCESQNITLLRTISHELRTPINGMHGSLTIMKQMVPSSILQYYTIAEVCTILLLNTVNCMVDYTSIKSGIFKPNKIQFNINDLQNYIRKLFEVKAEISKIDFQVKIHFLNSIQKILIYSDYERIKQVIIQLLQNAFNLTLEGFVHIDILINYEEGYLDFSLCDSGLGMTDEQISYILAKYSSTKDHFQYAMNSSSCLNLGTKTSALILEKLNSNLFINSEIGKGTRYAFKLNVEFQMDKKEEHNKSIIFKNMKNPKLNKQPSTFNITQLKSLKFLKKLEGPKTITKPNLLIIQKV